MRIALITESDSAAADGVRPGVGEWCRLLTGGLPEHDFRVRAVTAVHSTAAEGPPRGRLPRRRRRRELLDTYRRLVLALVHPQESHRFPAALRDLADAAVEEPGGGLPALLRSEHAQRVLEQVWQSPGAGIPGGAPTLREVLTAVDLLAQCLRPLSAPWCGPAEGMLGDVDLCHVVGGGPAVLPALVARRLHGTPFLLTEPVLRLREQYLAARAAPHRRPVRALLLSFHRLLAEEAYRQAAVLTSGSDADRAWQLRCGADPGRVRVVRQPLTAGGPPAAAPEPLVPTLVCSGSGDWDSAEPGGGPGPVLGAFAAIRAELPQARLLLYGTWLPDRLARYRVAAEALGLPAGVAHPAGSAPAVEFREPEEPAAQALAAGSVLLCSAPAHRPSRPLAEAMLSGRPVVCADTGIAREVLGPAGLVVPAGDAPALAAACLELLRDQERRIRLGRAGRLRAQELFAPEPAVEAFRALYLEILSRWPTPPAAGAGRGPVQPFARPAEYWATGETAGETPGETAGATPPEPPPGGGRPTAAARLREAV